MHQVKIGNTIVAYTEVELEFSTEKRDKQSRTSR